LAGQVFLFTVAGMNDFLASLILAIVVFVSTDMDNLLILTVFFADPKMQASSIILGQYLGIGALVLLSAASALLALTIPATWISLLGIVPAFLGVRGLVMVIFHRNNPDIETVAKQEKRLQIKTHSQVISVALVAIAHGADNLGIYIPVFAKTPTKIPLYVGVFAIMVGVSCFLSRTLVNNRLLKGRIDHYGRILIPLILIALGAHILQGAWPLVSRKMLQ
jgi:cadmium resistance protein CadD (predicted permease)